jgi:aspartate/methionine/tyrosine aminotransferase
MVELGYSGTLEVADKIRSMIRDKIEIINFVSGTLRDTPLDVKTMTKKAIDNDLGADLTDSAGLFELRNSIADNLYLKTKLSYDPHSDLVITVGAKNAILEAIQATVSPGEEILLIDPYWPSYKQIIALSGAVPRAVPMGKNNYFDITEKNIVNNIGPKSRMIIVNTPHNPTGRVFNENELDLLSHIAKKYSLIILSDESYRDLVYGNYKHLSIAAFPGMKSRTIIIYSFSKSFSMYGWRVGYAAADREIIGKMIAIQSNTVSCPTTFAQEGCIAALKIEEKHIANIVERYERLRDMTVKLMNKICGISCAVPEGAFWVFPDFSKLSCSTIGLADNLLNNYGIAITKGSFFGDNAQSFFRLIYRHEEPYLKYGLKKLKKAIESLANLQQ